MPSPINIHRVEVLPADVGRGVPLDCQRGVLGLDLLCGWEGTVAGSDWWREVMVGRKEKGG